MSEKLSERSVKWRVDHDVLGGKVNVRAMTRAQVAAEIAALEAKLEAMERVRELLDEFQQEAQTRWKDYAPEQVNSWLIRIKTAAQQEKE